MQKLHENKGCWQAARNLASSCSCLPFSVNAAQGIAEPYTLITFAPVQGFISASRKLRDLYGSSLLLSYLARAILQDAEKKLGADCVISPALVSTSRGTPNQLVIRGDYRRGHGRDALQKAWAGVLGGCRGWIEEQLRPQFRFEWESAWKQVQLHSWEYFHSQGATISEARELLRDQKQARAWEAVNWTGESSTLSSSEAVCRPLMGAVIDPREIPPGALNEEANAFCAALVGNSQLGEAFLGRGEQLSIAELVKRLVTYEPIARRAFEGESYRELRPESFRELASAGTVVWFMADGDSVGEHLRRLGQSSDEATALNEFSGAMRHWAQSLYDAVPAAMGEKATVIYAGGDDLLGALHDIPGERPEDLLLSPLGSDDLWHWLQSFHGVIWPQHGQQGLTVSMGLAWCRGQVPQREALAQVRNAEKAAKQAGRNRFALRLLFSGGRHLEWICPWQLLGPLLSAYRDREQRSGSQALWRHLSDDLEWLAARDGLSQKVAETLWGAYFGDRLSPPANHDEHTPIGPTTIHEPLEEWMRHMALVLATLSKAR